MVGLSQSIHQRNYQRARARALVRLSRHYQDHYKELLEEEKTRDEQMGKRWIGIDPDTGNPITIQSQQQPVSTQASTSNYGTNQGDNGGEA